jgi:Tfp pilus assembly protein FimV
MEPASGVPSFTLYRGSLLALLIGTALAVWLLVQPPGNQTDAAIRPVVLSPTPGAAVAPAVTTPAPAVTQPANATPAAVTTPTPTATRPPATPSGGSGQYTVASGDTLSGICAAQRPSLGNVDCVAQLRTLNSLSGDDLSVGQVLRLP